MKIDYREARKEVSIVEVLLDLGYKYDKSKGGVSPNFVLRDEHGKEIDRVIVKNPKNLENQGYWRRDGGKGDLIDFIRENLAAFPVTGRNDVDTLNRVLARYMGKEEKESFNLDDYLDKAGIHEAKEFDASRYDRLDTAERIDHVMTFFEQRGLSRETAMVFAPFIELVRKKADEDSTSPKAIYNLGFPYHTPGSAEIVGYEIRGYKGFKGKAEGTNSTSGLWMTEPESTHGKEAAPLPHQIQRVFFFESAFDAMAFWQLNHDRIDFTGCILASTGGSFSDQQITETMNFFHKAQAIDCFDNDLQGRLYGCRMVCLLEYKAKNLEFSINGEMVHFQLGDKQFDIASDLVDVETFRAMTGIYGNRVLQEKSPEPSKDWNEALKMGII
jgi:hypothetical protein